MHYVVPLYTYHCVHIYYGTMQLDTFLKCTIKFHEHEIAPQI